MVRALGSAVPLPLTADCPVLSQVFDNTPAALDGTVAAGDEITGVNGKSVKGKTKVEVAKMIQMVKVRGRRGLLQLLAASCPWVKGATAACC